MMLASRVISSWRIALTNGRSVFYWVLALSPDCVSLPACVSRNSYPVRRTSIAVLAPGPTRYTERRMIISTLKWSMIWASTKPKPPYFRAAIGQSSLRPHYSPPTHMNRRDFEGQRGAGQRPCSGSQSGERPDAQHGNSVQKPSIVHCG